MPRLEVLWWVLAAGVLCVVNLFRGVLLATTTTPSTTTQHSTTSLTMQSLYSDSLIVETSHAKQQQQQQHTRPPQDGDVFAPGTLSMSRLEAFSMCYIDPVRYKKHLQRPLLCAISETYNISYHLIPKSASSTGRHVMKETFAAEEHHCSQNERQTNLHFTIVRDPLSRFLASFDEMLLRYVSRHAVQRKFILPDEYASALVPYRKVPYRKFVRTPPHRLKDTLIKFVQNYDAAYPFDPHLRLQVPALANPVSGEPLPFIDALWDVSSLNHDNDDKNENAWDALAQQVHAPKPPATLRARQSQRRYNITADGTAKERRTLQKICQLQAIDYCCLNYPLPDACQGVVSCQWKNVTTRAATTTTNQQQHHQDGMLLRIVPVSPHPPRVLPVE